MADTTHPDDADDPPEEHEPLGLLWPEMDDADPDRLDHETAAIAARRVKVFQAYLRRRSVLAIVEEVGCSRRTVYRDIRHVLDNYKRLVLKDAGELLARQLAKLERQSAEAWAAWERSKGEVVETQTEQRTRDQWKAQGARVKKRQRDGDPRFLLLVNKFWLQECQLYGLLKPDASKDAHKLPPVKLVAGFDPAEVV